MYRMGMAYLILYIEVSSYTGAGIPSGGTRLIMYNQTNNRQIPHKQSEMT